MRENGRALAEAGVRSPLDGVWVAACMAGIFSRQDPGMTADKEVIDLG